MISIRNGYDKKMVQLRIKDNLQNSTHKSNTETLNIPTYSLS